jgi:rod shape-determining protein MreD
MRSRYDTIEVRPPVVGSPVAVLVTLTVALFSVLLLGLIGAEARFVAHLALAPLFMTAIAERDRIGPVGAFATGLVVDALSAAPLGVCAAAYLAFHAIASREATSLREVPLLLKWLFYLPLAAAVVGIHVAAGLLQNGGGLSRLELALSMLAACLAYPVLSLVAMLYGAGRERASRPARR